MDFTEADWKLFRNKIVVWQTAYIDKINKEYIEILSSDAEPAKKFWHIERRINKDKRSPGVIAKMRRSRLIYNLYWLLDEGVITREDLNDFSEELRKTMRVI